jgi:hypothetical protein
MKLDVWQKKHCLKLVAQGLSTSEINEQAAKYKRPYEVSESQVSYYRVTRAHDLKAISKLSEREALINGFSQKEKRVHVLSLLAALMTQDLTGGLLWLEDEKGVGSGDAAKTIEIERFNASEVAQLRGVLDDIAKEMGHRVQGSVNLNIDWSKLSDSQLDRIIAGESVVDVIAEDV